MSGCGAGGCRRQRPARPGRRLASRSPRSRCDAWRTCYAPHLPPGALDALDVDAGRGRLAGGDQHPPSPAHRLLVALAGGRIVGYLAVGPGEDEDAGPADGEVLALTVAPAEQRMGHGSRLLAAAVQR